jgi:HAD superfamily hydrolase (TIGR01509 family)
MTVRIRCRAVFVDAGGVLVLPDRHLLASALAGAGIDIDTAGVPRAHYRAVRALDRALLPGAAAATRTDYPRALLPNATAATRTDHPRALLPNAAAATRTDYPRALLPDATATATATAAATATATATDYPQALLPQLGIEPRRTAEALAAWERLADRDASGEVLWREPTPGAHGAIASIRRAGIAIVVVTNSDGHGEENLRACGFDLPVIDSTVVGAAKPDPRIFHMALARAGVPPPETVHVGDTLSADVAGACAAGITPIHFDPPRACRATDHRHIRSLPGLWRHITNSTIRPSTHR